MRTPNRLRLTYAIAMCLVFQATALVFAVEGLTPLAVTLCAVVPLMFTFGVEGDELSILRSLLRARRLRSLRRAALPDGSSVVPTKALRPPQRR